MKLSELSTDRALDTLCEMTPYIANIMGDEKIVSALSSAMPQNPDGADQTEKKDDEKSSFSVGVQMMSGLANMAPILLREHRPDVYGILSAMNETSANKIATQKLTDTIKQVREVFQDDELLSFFKSSVRREKTAPSVPSAASPVSE